MRIESILRLLADQNAMLRPQDRLARLIEEVEADIEDFEHTMGEDELEEVAAARGAEQRVDAVKLGKNRSSKRV